ncbi:MAG: HlyD family efflux transporter periplasmic adaptor subunit [Kiritimatiellae bacterium]|jgi:HlyD family secretion protein|nr:HlyD family efflux transporter periplasmic adaptor subunit [Kiritimatiellia bacterium]
MRTTTDKLQKSAGACAALAAGLLLMPGCAENKAPSYQGYVEGEFVYVSSAEAGRLDRLAVTRGDSATNGAVLFVLESDNEAAAQRQARHQLGVAEAQLKDLRVGKRPPELAVIRAQMAQASAEEKRAAADLIRDEAQYQAGGISAAQLDAARALAESLAARVRELERQLDVAALPARDDQIRAQESAVAAARATLEQADWKLRQKTVSATVAGVVFDTLYRVGEWVPAGHPVVRLLPPENVKIRFFVPEPIIGGLQVGKEITLRCDGRPADVRASVSYVSAESEYTPPIIYSNETRSKLVYMVEARPSAADAGELHPGQPVEVFLP